MQTLSSTHRAFDRSLEAALHLAGAAAAATRRWLARVRTESTLGGLCDEQRDDAGLDRRACRPQTAIEARMMSDLMSMR